MTIGIDVGSPREGGADGDRYLGTRLARILAASLALAAVLCLSYFYLRHVVAVSIYYDDAHNANVPKNLALGFGYSTSYHEIRPFNPEASTGPTILLPAAALIRVFGNQHWVPHLAIVLSIAVTLTLLIWLLQSYLTNTELLAAMPLFALSLMVFQDEIGLLGEVPGAFLGCASIVLVGRSGGRSLLAFGAGLLLGLAILCKLIIALVIPSALLYLLILPAAKQRASARLGAVAFFIGGVLLPLALWQGVQLLATELSVHDWIVLKARQFAFFMTWSGIGEVQETASPGRILITKAIRNGKLLKQHFGLLSISLMTAALCSTAVFWLRIRPRDGRLGRLRLLLLSLLAAFATHLGWWWLFSREGWYRHLLPGTLYLLVGASIAGIATLNRSRIWGTLALALLVASWAPHFGNLRRISGGLKAEPRLQALVAARDEMIKLKRNPDYVFVGYAWWVPRDLEYMLPSVGNFKDVLRLQPADIAGKKIVLVRNEFFNWEKSAVVSEFQLACDRQVLFRQDPFVISVCVSLPGRP